jgi:SAM-dependent methyltransferase
MGSLVTSLKSGYAAKAAIASAARWSPHEHRDYSIGGPNPFAESPLRRHTWAFDRLKDLPGMHLDIGCNQGSFTGNFAATTGRECVAVDVDRNDLGVARLLHPGIGIVAVDASPGLPFRSAAFQSVSLLDVLEHVSDDAGLLAETARVVVPGGTVVVSVPARHVFSMLDPDNAGFRFRRLHKAAWSVRFGTALYQDRFVDRSDGMFGDVAACRGQHENYDPARVAELFGAAGLLIQEMAGSGFWFRWLQMGALVLGRSGGWCDRAIVADGDRHTGSPGSGLARRANLFVVGRRPA